MSRILLMLTYIRLGHLCLGGFDMLKTITIGNYISVQGMLEQQLPDGRMSVRVGNTVYTGHPVMGKAAA